MKISRLVERINQMVQSSLKTTLDTKVLHNPQSHLFVQDLNSFLNEIINGDSLSLGGSICHSF